MLAVSCPLLSESRQCLPRPTLACQLQPLSIDEMKSGLSRRFPNRFNTDFVHALWHYSHGFPARVALKIGDLLEADLLREDDGQWYINGDVRGDRLLLEFEPDAYAELHQVRSALPDRQSAIFAAFVKLSAVCEANIPAALLLSFLGVAPEEMDDYLDLTDNCELFVDLGYGQPGFEGLLVYNFGNPVLAAVILMHLGMGEREQLALPLLAHLRTTLHLVNRAKARLLLTVAFNSGNQATYDQYRNQLEWWVGEIDGLELRSALGRALDACRLSPDLVLAQAISEQATGSLHKASAILDSLTNENGELRLGLTSPGTYHYLKAIVAARYGRFGDAVGGVALALATGVPADMVAAVLNLGGTVCLKDGMFEDAVTYFHQARARIASTDIEALGSIASNIGSVYVQQFRYAEAEPYFLEALHLHEQVARPNDIHVAISCNNLADAYRHQAKEAEARPLYARALRIRRLNPGHPGRLCGAS